MKSYILGILTVGMTLVGAHASFYTHQNSFGILSAVIATGVFEILRLATLFSLFSLENKFKSIAIPFYTGLFIICMFTSTVGFLAKTEQQYDEQLADYKKELIKRSVIVQTACVKHYQPKIKHVESKIDTLHQWLSGNPNHTYWINRLDGRIKELNKLIAERDSIIVSLNFSENDGFEKRINKYAVVYGITLPPLNKTKGGLIYIRKAISDLIKLDLATSLKVLAIGICLGVECSIIILAFYSSHFAKKYPKPKKIKKENILREKILQNKIQQKLITRLNSNGKVLAGLREKFDDKRIQKFIEKSQDYYLENDGRLPASKDLSRNLREVKNYVTENFEKKDIDKFFGVNGN
jgi:hypothetical protein